MAVTGCEGVIWGCSVLKEEVETLRQQFWPAWKGQYLTSMLHMRPRQLESELMIRIQHELSRGNPVLMVYGDCCQAMDTFEQYQGVARTAGVNCCELILGKKEYKALMAAGAFFLLPEWTIRWKEIFTNELGLNQVNASAFMQEMHSQMIYLDTGVRPIPSGDIEACSRYCGLPYTIKTVTLEHLKTTIQTAMDQLVPGDNFA